MANIIRFGNEDIKHCKSSKHSTFTFQKSQIVKKMLSAILSLDFRGKLHKIHFLKMEFFVEPQISIFKSKNSVKFSCLQRKFRKEIAE